ncbi:TPA: hypothetical protein ACH3X3_006384 [Trebouxia sp. C0006]
MVKPKPKSKEALQSVADKPSDSKQSDSAKHSSPEAEDSPAPDAATAAPTIEDKFVCTQAIAGPFAKKTKLQQQLNAVEKQIFDLETSLVSSSERPYSVFKGYGGLVPGNKRKATKELPERIFSDSSTTKA